MKVLVTGASGFIGRHITAHLAEQAGIEVLAGSRNPDMADVASCRLDVRDAASLGAALAGIEAVVHCAVGDRATTVQGTANLLFAAKRAGVRRVVHLSSVAVYGAAEGEVTEAMPTIAGNGRGYAHWKAAAEWICRAQAGRLPSIVILRPAIVYGAGSQLWVHTLARRIILGRWGRFGSDGAGICNLVHVRDVATAASAALSAADGCEVFNVNGPEPVTWNTWFTQFARAIGRPELPAITGAAWRRRSRTALPLKAAARLIPPLRRYCERHLLGAPSASELALYRLRATYRIDKARVRLGWKPAVGLNEGTQDAVHWLREIGAIT